MTYDPIPETCQEALVLWDAGESVFSVEMGGLGPGYEQCIQILAFEFLRVLLAADWKIPDPFPDDGSEAQAAYRDKWRALSDPVVTALDKQVGGFSGAQVGAAGSLAMATYRRGYRTALRDPEIKDRLIQVSRTWPRAEAGTP